MSQKPTPSHEARESWRTERAHLLLPLSREVPPEMDWGGAYLGGKTESDASSTSIQQGLLLSMTGRKVERITAAMDKASQSSGSGMRLALPPISAHAVPWARIRDEWGLGVAQLILKPAGPSGVSPMALVPLPDDMDETQAIHDRGSHVDMNGANLGLKFQDEHPLHTATKACRPERGWKPSHEGPAPTRFTSGPIPVFDFLFAACLVQPSDPRIHRLMEETASRTPRVALDRLEGGLHVADPDQDLGLSRAWLPAGVARRMAPRLLAHTDPFVRERTLSLLADLGLDPEARLGPERGRGGRSS